MENYATQSPKQNNFEAPQPSPVENTVFHSTLTKETQPNFDIGSTISKTEPDVIEFTNPYLKNSGAPSEVALADDKKTGDAPSEKAPEKPLRRSDLPDFKKFSPDEQAKTAADLAKEIGEKGFTPSPELRDKIRAAMLRAYMDGDKDGPGNQKAMEKFVEQMNEKLPKGMSLKIDASETNKDFTTFRDRAQAAIDKQPGMKMGTCGQLQLCKTADGKTSVVDKMHYAASIKKAQPRVNV